MIALAMLICCWALAALAQAAPAVDLMSCMPDGTNSVPGLSILATRVPGEADYLFQSATAKGGATLTRFALASSDDGQLRIGVPLWDAGAILTGNAQAQPPQAGQPAPALRQIYTSSDGGITALIPFQWAALSAGQRALLNQPTGAAPADGLGELRLNYVRGERSGEASGAFRPRVSVLGDSVHAAPVYVGAPAASVPGALYGKFYERYQGRRKVLYLGANDGMLHAFDALNGSELFAYIPNALIASLNQLSSMTERPRPYLDGAASASAALLAGQWKTVLVSGMGGGAQGVFALDVSDPEHFQDRGVLWEFTDQQDVAMGNVSAAPVIAKFRISAKTEAAQYRYFAVASSGLNNYVDEGSGRFARTPAAALFLLALDKPATEHWKRGVNYFKITLPVTDSTVASALGPPALVNDADGAVAYAYLGDLQGNVWRIDFSGTPPWSNSVGPGPGKQPLFVARDAAGARQPITQQVKVAFAPGGGYVILFGTGKLVEASDTLPGNFAAQSFYAIQDDLKQVVSDRNALLARTVSEVADGSGRTLNGSALSYAGSNARQGWYLDFPQAQSSGERSVSSASLFGGKVFFNTVLPGKTACSALAVRTYAIDIVTGFALSASGAAVTGAVTGVRFEAVAAAAPLLVPGLVRGGERDARGSALLSQSVQVFNLGRNGSAQQASPATLALPSKRMSWREIANWRELHEAAMK